MPERQYAMVVAVPKTQKGAFNPDRRISSLIQAQLRHIREAEKQSLPADQQTNIDISKLETERQASDYLQKVMARLHPQGARKPADAAGEPDGAKEE
jgi:hypothetical protein